MNHFVPSGVCAKGISFKVENGLLTSVSFTSGCPGNLEGIARLTEGMPVAQVIERLQGITCGKKSTSCPDQLSLALKKWLLEQGPTVLKVA